MWILHQTKTYHSSTYHAEDFPHVCVCGVCNFQLLLPSAAATYSLGSANTPHMKKMYYSRREADDAATAEASTTATTTTGELILFDARMRR